MENVKLLLRCGMSGRSVKMPKTASAPFRTLPTSHTLIMKVNSRMTNTINKHSLVTIMVMTSGTKLHGRYSTCYYLDKKIRAGKLF